MNRYGTIRKFYDAVKMCNSIEVLKFFTEMGKVHTPLRETENASIYFPEIFSHTKSLQFDIKEFFTNIEDQNHVMAYLSIIWELPNGTAHIKNSSSLFYFEPSSNRIETLTTMYDATQLKAIKNAVPF